MKPAHGEQLVGFESLPFGIWSAEEERTVISYHNYLMQNNILFVTNMDGLAGIT